MKDYTYWFSFTAALDRWERDLQERLMLVEREINERREVVSATPNGEWL